MEQKATRDDVQLFAQAVEHLGYKRNVSTGRVVPLPPNADDTVATYRDRDTGRRICVWPVTTDEQAAELGTIADRHGFRFVQYGRPRPRQNTQHSDDEDRCAAGHRPRPDGTCPVCAAPRTDTCNGGQVAGRTPMQQHALGQARRLRALAAKIASKEALAAACGDQETADVVHNDAEAVAVGAAAVERKALEDASAHAGVTVAERSVVQAALAYRDIWLAEEATGCSPAMREFAEQRLLKAAQGVAEERGLEADRHG